MYPCSSAFHRAVAANEPQMALFVFENGAVLTNEDFDVDAGIQFDDYFCTKEDLGIGEALSNEIRFKLMNEKQLLNSFDFGEFTALLGVQTSATENTKGFSLTYRGHTYTATARGNTRLLRDGTATSGQPSFKIASMAAKDGIVYCFAINGQAYGVSATSGAAVSVPNTAFMRDKATRWAGRTFSYDSRVLTIRETGGAERTYEFVPLGIFNAEKPKVVDDIQIDLVCNDRMQRFDHDMADLEVPYPITLSALLSRICQSENVTVASGDMLNGDHEVAEKPDEFDSCSKRDVIGWIAEVGGCNAKITRDGALKMYWLANTSQSFGAGNYTECRPYYYQTQKVNRLCVRDMSAAEDQMTGSGENTYLIQDNPFLRVVTDEE